MALNGAFTTFLTARRLELLDRAKAADPPIRMADDYRAKMASRLGAKDYGY